MKKLLLVSGFLICCFNISSAEKLIISSNAGNASVDVLQSTIDLTVLEVNIGSIDLLPVKINDRTYQEAILEDEAVIRVAGEPQLPRISRSLIIPDDQRMEVRVLSSEYIELPDINIAPSKGNFPRTINPEDVPYEFGSVYTFNGFYPNNLAELREPYILRDFRGTVIDINAVQFNPITNTLRIYTSIRIEIRSAARDNFNILRRTGNTIKLVPDYDLIYQERFINYQQGLALYTPVEEVGDLLIISYGSFMNYIQPLVDWKRQKGIRTALVNVSTIGNNSTAIRNYIQAFYDSTNLAHVLLVGDAAQVATYLSGGAASDPSYAKVAGSDNYPDIFIGRFSAENVAQVQTQVARTLDYEKYVSGNTWYHQATGIASAEGPGHFGEYDYQHMNLIRNDLLTYNYTLVDQIYDPGATAAQVTAALNAGRGFVNYCGHGSSTSWGTTGFSNSNVNALNNAGKLPFIVSVACVNGEFNTGTCFAEAWLRANSGGNPTGALATYMSSINQSWNPPMDAQDEATDLLRAGSKMTFGGICYNGSCKMIDLNGQDGVDMYDTWHIFGDPSIQLRTDDPIALTVNNDETILFTSQNYQLQVVGIGRALCALYYGGDIIGTAYTASDGSASIAIGNELPIGEYILLTVTGFNLQTYIDSVLVISPSGPYVIFDNASVNDIFGNNNGVVDYGENIRLGVQLKNVGPDTAFGVTATLECSDQCITITDGNESFGTIPGNNGTAYRQDGFAFAIEGNIQDNHSISFQLSVSGISIDTWTSTFSITAYAPQLQFSSLIIDDGAGNGNGILDPGEIVNLIAAIQNTGLSDAEDITGTLTEIDSYITITDPIGFYNDIPNSGGIADNSTDPFVVEASASCPMGHAVPFAIVLGGSRGLSDTVVFNLVVGDKTAAFEDDFSTNSGWTGTGGLGEWTVGLARGGTGLDSYGGPDPAIDHSPSTDNWVMGNDLTAGNGGDYGTNLGSTYYITSPIIDCTDFTELELTFFRWLGVERDTYDHARLQAYNGTTWVTLFENSDTSIDETSWNEQLYDISSIADGIANFRLRFGIGPTDGAWQFCGWNIDDLTIKGFFHGSIVNPELSLTPSSILDTLIQGQILHGIINVRNIGNSELQITFTPSESWLDCSPAMQIIPASDSLDFPFTIDAANLEPGLNSASFGYITNDEDHSDGTIPVEIIYLTGGCIYVAGDINGNGLANGLDAGYGCNYLKGGPVPPDSCFCSGHGLIYASGDVNNSCSFNGLDISYMVNYYKGGPAFIPCQDCPPQGSLRQVTGKLIKQESGPTSIQ